MKWRTGRKSDNVEDRRSSGISGKAAGGIGGLGIILLLLVSMFLGVDPGQFIQGIDSTGSLNQGSQMSTEEQNRSKEFVSLVLGDTEATWSDIFAEQLGRTYIEPKLVLFTGGVQSACGQASSQVGPFYCPSDQKVYLDLEFLKELQDRLGATGDFAQAYVISHEVGHHVQTLTGTLQYVDTMNKRVSQTEANELSVALELQADCYAGVWANRASQQDLILEPGDIEEGLNAASAAAAARQHPPAQGSEVPESCTPGPSAQRVASFRKGLESGDMYACDSSLLPAVK